TIRIHAVLKGDVQGGEATFVLSTRGGLKDFDPQVKPGDNGVFFLDHANGSFKKAYWGSIALFTKNNFSTAAAPEPRGKFGDPFPRIPAGERPASLALIEGYARNNGWAPLRKDTFRFILQPMGVVGEAYEIDLVSGKAVVFPPMLQNVPLKERQLSDAGLRQLRQLLGSDEFRGLKPLDSKVGLDGTTWFMEADLGGGYQWLVRWQPEEQVLNAVRKVVSAECNKSEQK
nr:hypothetical protein [Candidatus Ozemobacteraceae bacterium]